MAVYFWNVFSGLWNDPASWLGGVAPGSGDQGVVAHGVLTNATVDFTDLTVSGQTISVIAANQLSFSGSTIGADASLTNLDADGLVMSFVGTNTFDGPVFLQGSTQFYLIPATAANLVNNAWIDITGPASVMGSGTLTNNGLIHVGGIAGQAGGLGVIGGGVSLVNAGTVTVEGVADDPVGNTSVRFGSASGNGTVSASHAEVAFTGAVTEGLFQFNDDSAILQLNVDTAEYNAVIAGFKPGNRIDLGSTQADAVAYAADPGGYTGTLTVSFEGTAVAALHLDGFYAGYSFVLSDIGGDMGVTTVPCFAAGTLLATPTGEAAVEALRPGDAVLLADGTTGRVVWTGWREVACGQHPRPHDVLPVRVRASAFAAGVPLRDVVLSPDHAVFAAGVLIPVRYLLNGATVLQQAVRRVTYWHVELERHAVMLAAGLAVESYLDTGNRGDFANGPQPRRLHPDFAPVDPMAVWSGKACAPLRLEGAEVEAVRRGLLARAGAMGWRPVAGGKPCVLVDGRVVAPRVDGDSWLVLLPLGARRLVLESGAGVPRQMRLGAADGRRLGVAVAGPLWNGVPAGLGDARFGAGWHAAEPDWRWTDGAGTIDVTGLADIGFTLVAAERHWLAPVGGGRRAAA